MKKVKGCVIFVSLIYRKYGVIMTRALFLKKMVLTPCKTEQPLQGTELQEKEA